MSQIVNCEPLSIAQGNWQLSKNSLFDGLGFWETKAIKSANGFYRRNERTNFIK